MKQKTKENIQIGMEMGLAALDGLKDGLGVVLGWALIDAIPGVRAFKGILKPALLAAGIAGCFIRAAEYPDRVVNAWEAFDLDNVFNVENRIPRSCLASDHLEDESGESSGLKMQIGFRIENS